MRIAIIGHNLWGVGGTVRTIYNLAHGLASSHDIELVSVYRRTDTAAFNAPRSVKVTSLVDGRPHSKDRKSEEFYRPSKDVPASEELYSQYSELTDSRLRSYLTSTRADVIVGTRTSINLMLAEHGPESAVRVGQEHSGHQTIDPATRAHMRSSYGALDAVVTVTEADAALVRAGLDLPSTPVVAIPNSIPAPGISTSTLDSGLIVAAGRIEPAKRFELLIHAFARLASEHPEWNVRLYGSGSAVGGLRDLIHSYGLDGRVRLMGSVQNMGDEWTKAAIAVSTSDAESFGMTLVEAMRAGVPLISTDCPTGPREIITSGEDGILIPTGEVEPLVKTLHEMMSSKERRMELSAGGLRRGEDFDISAIADRHAQLLSRLMKSRGFRRIDLSRAWSTLPVPGRRPGAISITATAAPGAALTFTVRSSSPRALKNAHLVLRSNHSADQVLELPLAASSSQHVDVDSKTFTNDAEWTIELRGPHSQDSDLDWHADGRSIIRTAAAQGRLRHVVPFMDGEKLKLRSWKRNHHTEVDTIDVMENGIRIHATTSFDRTPADELVLTRRSDGRTLKLSAGSSVEERSIELQIPVDDMVSMRLTTHDDWDVTYRSKDIRSKVARVLDDIVDHKRVDRYRSWNWFEEEPAATGGTEAVVVRPYFTPRQGLALSVVSYR